MQLKGEQLLPVDQQAAWLALNDTSLLKEAIPGCQSITPADAPNTYDLVMIAAIGPVKATFKGTLELIDLAPPASYTIRFEGNGGVAGFGKGTAAVKLVPDGPQTKLGYEANASVGGKIAQIGSRLIDMAAKKIAGNFFENFNEALQKRQA